MSNIFTRLNNFFVANTEQAVPNSYGMEFSNRINSPVGHPNQQRLVERLLNYESITNNSLDQTMVEDSQNWTPQNNSSHLISEQTVFGYDLTGLSEEDLHQNEFKKFEEEFKSIMAIEILETIFQNGQFTLQLYNSKKGKKFQDIEEAEFNTFELNSQQIQKQISIQGIRQRALQYANKHKEALSRLKLNSKFELLIDSLAAENKRINNQMSSRNSRLQNLQLIHQLKLKEKLLLKLPDLIKKILEKHLDQQSVLLQLIEDEINQIIFENHPLFERREE